MAKGSSGKAGGPSRIRFIMVEAEMTEGDIGQITQAIQNALRGPAPIVQRITAPSGEKAPVQEAAELDVEVDADEGGQIEEIQRSLKPKGQRKAAPTPDVLDIDLVSEPSLASYAQKANPKSDRKRYLVIAAWFKECRDVNSITADHIYTCYRSLKWPTTINDFAQPLRSLKAGQYFSSSDRGQYSINHLGLAEVQKLLSGGE